MSDNLFTLMIIPSRKSGVKKISVSRVVIRNILITSIVAILEPSMLFMIMPVLKETEPSWQDSENKPKNNLSNSGIWP